MEFYCLYNKHYSIFALNATPKLLGMVRAEQPAYLSIWIIPHYNVGQETL